MSIPWTIWGGCFMMEAAEARTVLTQLTVVLLLSQGIDVWNLRVMGKSLPAIVIG